MITQAMLDEWTLMHGRALGCLYGSAAQVFECAPGSTAAAGEWAKVVKCCGDVAMAAAKADNQLRSHVDGASDIPLSHARRFLSDLHALAKVQADAVRRECSAWTEGVWQPPMRTAGRR